MKYNTDLGIDGVHDASQQMKSFLDRLTADEHAACTHKQHLSITHTHAAAAAAAMICSVL